ncbi:MAG: HAMP domain-containing sensor histidine kinase [Acidobacteriota bacterium]
MAKKTVNSHQEFFRALMEIVAENVPVPIGLYQTKNSEIEEVIPESSRAKYVSHCNLIQSFNGGKQQCQKDQLERAKNSLAANKDLSQDCCWAGIYNESRLIKIDRKPFALLVYGGGKVTTTVDKQESLRKHEEAVKLLGLTEEQARELRNSLREINDSSISKDGFLKIQKVFTNASHLISELEERQNQAKYIAERNSHEIATRLQAVIAEADNLVSQINVGEITEAKRTALSVLNSAESLNTVAQNLGNYLETYRFRRESLNSLVLKSIKTYEAEANRKEVQIRYNLIPPYDLEVSKNHLQYALNNLIQNAIKYSFRGKKDHQRFINIKGQPEPRFYPEGRFYRLKITNYGVGILPDEYEEIFKDGFQGQLTENEYRTGSGKGLSFVKRIIEEHNGTIEVESIPQSDDKAERKPYLTRFIIRLPYSQK